MRLRFRLVSRGEAVKVGVLLIVVLAETAAQAGAELTSHNFIANPEGLSLPSQQDEPESDSTGFAWMRLHFKNSDLGKIVGSDGLASNKDKCFLILVENSIFMPVQFYKRTLGLCKLSRKCTGRTFTVAGLSGNFTPVRCLSRGKYTKKFVNALFF